MMTPPTNKLLTLHSLKEKVADGYFPNYFIITESLIFLKCKSPVKTLAFNLLAVANKCGLRIQL
jgi:hypothetical protein